MKSGDKFQFSITYGAQVLSDSDDEITESQIIDTIYSDEAFGLKSVIIGRQMDIVWDSTEIQIF